MKILGIDTSCDFCSLGVIEEGNILGEWTFKSKMSQLTRIVPGIKMLLENIDLKLKDLGGIAVTTGPGSFTGVRLGLVTAKTLSQATGKKLAGVNSLDALVFQFHLQEGLIIPLIDAGKKEVCGAIYRKEGDRIIKISEERLYTPLEMAFEVNSLKEKIHFTGMVNSIYKKILTEELKCLFYWHNEINSIIRGSSVAFLGREKLKRGYKDSYLELLPLYIRPPDVKIKDKVQL